MIVINHELTALTMRRQRTNPHPEPKNPETPPPPRG